MARHADFTTGTYTGISPANVSASGGYAAKLDGLLTAFAPNTLRRTNKGLLVEPASTNYIPNSDDFAGRTFSNSSGSISITSNAAIAPDGTTTADRIDINRFGTDAYAIFNPDVSVPAGTYYPSIWLKAWDTGDVGKSVYLCLQAGSAVPVDTHVLTADWVRVTPTARANPVQFFGGYPNNEWSGSSQTGPVSFLVWGQNVTPTGVSSEIPTSGSTATRSADAVGFTIPAGVTTLTYTFDDNSTQDVSVTPGASYTVPTNLNRRYIKYIDGNGAVGTTGTSAITLAAIGASGSGSVAIKGSAATTLGAVVAAGAAGTLIRAQAAITLGPIATASAGTTRIAGQATAAIGDVQCVASGAARISATAAITLGPVTTESAAKANIAATASVTLGPITVSASGSSQSVNTGAVAATLGEIEASAAGRVLIAASATQTLGPIIASGTAVATVRAVAAIQIGAIATTSAAVVRLQGQVTLPLGVIGVTATGTTSFLDFIVPSPRRTAHAPSRRRLAVAPARSRIIYAKEPHTC